MKLSIIIPVYNDAEGLSSTINTLLENNQELEDFEIIICIDGGLYTDVNMAIDLIKLHSTINISYICITPNKGSYNARNIGVEKAVGNVFSFLDAGVYVQKGWYTALQSYIQQYDYIAGAVEIPWDWANTLFEKYDSITSFPVKEYLSSGHFGPTANVSVKKDTFLSVGGFDSRLQSGGDCHFGKKVFNNKFSQGFCQEMLVFHKPRNRNQIIIKINRVNEGLSELQRLYPEFSIIPNERHYKRFIENMIKIVFSPSKFNAYRSNKLSRFDFLITQSTVTFYHFIARIKYF